MNKPSIIVFSKDRPMQLHAYIESLLLFSDVEQKNIIVLYKKTPNIDYSRVIKEYPFVNWIFETNFYDNLLSIINKSEDYIMFGCDDVVFKNEFSLEYAQDILTKNPHIFGFSFRLGTNLAPTPKSVSNNDKYLEWDWTKSDEPHFNYPWELDCTLYRKLDISEMIKSKKEEIKSPNYLEGAFAENPTKYIKRPCLACLNKPNQAIVITVNRVQETHCNPVDSSKPTDIYTLNKLYNEENNKLDIKTIAEIENYIIHVDSDYFILENRDKNWKKPRIKKCKYKKSKSKKVKIKKNNPLKIFIKNLTYLFRYNLKEMALNSQDESINRMFENMKYEIADELKNLKKPNIKSPEATIQALIDNRPSFCRFGDGEFTLIEGQGIPYQTPSSKLSFRLREILQSQDENIFIGVPYCFYSSVKGMRDFSKQYMRTWVSERRDQITDLCLPNKQYYDTTCSQMYSSYKDFDFKNYFENFKKVWSNRDITIICGETVFNKIVNNIFNCAKSIEYVYGPPTNAFDHYDSILDAAKQIDKNRLVLIILGPTATVLAYDLAKAGYQAIDLGHIAKDYDYYLKEVDHTEDSIAAFISPD